MDEFIKSTNAKPVAAGSLVEQLLNRYDTGHGIFITHLDRLAVRRKAMTFSLSFLVVCATLGAMAWRLSRYIFLGPLGRMYPSLKHDYSSDSWFKIIAFSCFDLGFFQQFPENVWEFIKTIGWARFHCKFSTTEVVFRKPSRTPPLQLEEILKLPDGEVRSWWDSLYHALDPTLLRKTVGYSSGTVDWDLDFAATVDGQTAATQGKIDIGTWETSVWIKWNDTWYRWEMLWRGDESEHFHRAVNTVIQGKLDALGQFGLFDEYMEYLTIKGGRSKELSTDVMKGATKLFADRGVDYHAILSEAVSTVRLGN
ncbi:hypothetical protein BDN72DRAFT_833394 [Pluteus cervinus]|uniref:Uncharacterized protein n=1 Tax=Pluteus cervinus TaxID=181527 RepID=A0ACD3B8Z1_9AGAR|nr:hypothetical protein BDN72DRAFT_833394 [Pluteus cervinus]